MDLLIKGEDNTDINKFKSSELIQSTSNPY